MNPSFIKSVLCFKIGLPPDPAKRASPEFARKFVRAYLEKKAELDGKTPSSVTEELVEQYTVWTYRCMQVSSFVPLAAVLVHIIQICLKLIYCINSFRAVQMQVVSRKSFKIVDAPAMRTIMGFH